MQDAIRQDFAAKQPQELCHQQAAQEAGLQPLGDAEAAALQATYMVRRFCVSIAAVKCMRGQSTSSSQRLPSFSQGLLRLALRACLLGRMTWTGLPDAQCLPVC